MVAELSRVCPKSRGSGAASERCGWCRARDAGVCSAAARRGGGLWAPGRRVGGDDGRVVARLSSLPQMCLIGSAVGNGVRLVHDAKGGRCGWVQAQGPVGSWEVRLRRGEQNCGVKKSGSCAPHTVGVGPRSSHSCLTWDVWLRHPTNITTTQMAEVKRDRENNTPEA